MIFFRVQESDIHLPKVFIYFSNHWSPLDILPRLRLRSNNATAWKRQKLGLSWPHAISGHFRQSFSCRGSEEVATDRDGSPWEAFWLQLGQDSSPYLRNVLYICSKPHLLVFYKDLSIFHRQILKIILNIKSGYRVPTSRLVAIQTILWTICVTLIWVRKSAQTVCLSEKIPPLSTSLYLFLLI